MSKVLSMAALLIVMAGCSSTATNDRLDALEAQIAGAQSTADEAMSLARQASSAAADTSSDASAARRMAEQAMETAEQTAERLRRMQDECCGGK